MRWRPENGKWIALIGLSIFFGALSVWNEYHWGIDPFFILIAILWIGAVAWFTWWFKMRDGTPRCFYVNGNFTIANDKPVCYIDAEGPWKKQRVYARQGIWRPRFMINLWGTSTASGGRLNGYFIAQDSYFKNVGVQVLCDCAKPKKYVTPEEKRALPPHYIPQLKNELAQKGLYYDDLVPIYYAARPSRVRVPDGVDYKDVEDQTAQVEYLATKADELTRVNKDWQDRYTAVSRALEAAQNAGTSPPSQPDHVHYPRQEDYDRR